MKMKMSRVKMFSRQFCEISKNAFLQRRYPLTASDILSKTFYW